MFARQRSPGLWTFDTPVEDFEFEYIDASLANAIDGYGGGAYALQADLTIGGAPGAEVQFDLPVGFSEQVLIQDLEVHGAVWITGSLLNIDSAVVTVGNTGADAFTVEAFSQFNDIVNFNAGAYFNDDASFAQDIDVNGSADFGGPVSFHDGTVTMGASGADAFTVNAFSTFNGIAIFGGSTFLGGATTSSGAGYIKARRVSRQAIGGNADASYSPVSYDHVHVPAGTLGAARNYTIDDTGAADGDRMEFSTQDVGFAINVKKPGGVQIAQIVGNTHMSCVVERIVGIWTLIRYSDYILH